MCSESATATTTLAAGAISRNRSNILNSADAETLPGEGTDSGLSAGARRLGARATTASELDVHSVDTNILEGLVDVDGSQHRSVGRRLFSIGLNLQAASDTAVGLATGEISDVDESVVEGSEEMDNTEVVL